jgi:hypothetical protein
MAKLTPKKAAQHVAYIERERSKGNLTPRLAEIEQHRLDFLLRMHCCVHCGTSLQREDSIEDWRTDGLGPVCRDRLAAQGTRWDAPAGLAS